MRQRNTIIEMFSTFLSVKDDRGCCTEWQVDQKLKRNMKNEPEPGLDASEQDWIKHWLDALQNPSKPLAIMHLLAYSHEPCYWAVKKLHPHFARRDLTWRDCFQIATEVVNTNPGRIFKNYDRTQSSPKAYTQMRIESKVKEFLLQGRRIDGASDWSLLKSFTAKKRQKTLEAFGIQEPDLSRCLLAWECFVKHYLKIPKEIKKNQRLPEPTPQEFADMITEYNKEQSHWEVKNEVKEKDIRTLLDKCVQALRNSAKIETCSLDDPNVPELSSDDMPAEEEEQEEEWEQIRCVLSQAFADLSQDEQTMLILHYGLELGQREIGIIFGGLEQYKVSRKLAKYKESLLKKLMEWSQDSFSVAITPQDTKIFSKQMHDWLIVHCQTNFRTFLQEKISKDLRDRIDLLILCCIEQLSPKRKLLPEEVAERLKITVNQVHQQLEDSRQYLLEHLKQYVQTTLNLQSSIERLISVDELLLKFIDNFLITAPYANFKKSETIYKIL
ncbi:sigma-70 family RNA polymerase sigma factor [Scytonema sp. UIC 10036]|uniref:sigma-70 family RNA polymerase sigma factor n=1 Tax=Scytonema sp. UIC 10036 TaxID=2304196 RepID=UPI00140FAFE9|nr:sigma-70 family RNA polymerase sigma factor [Scytonema sp. UIC 10036]